MLQVYTEKAKILDDGYDSKAGHVDLFANGNFSVNGGELQHSEDKNKAATRYNSFNFNHYGYYRNNYSSGGVGDGLNYARFLDNAAGSIYNTGVDMFYSVKNFSLAGVKQDFVNTFGHYWTSTPTQEWNATVAQFKATFSNIRFYENIGGALMTANASSVSKGIVGLTNPETMAFYHGTSIEGAASLKSGIDLSKGNV